LGTNDDFVPEPLNNGIDQRRAPCESRPPFTGDGKFLLDGSGFPHVQVPQLTTDGGHGGHFDDTLPELLSPAPDFIPRCSESSRQGGCRSFAVDLLPSIFGCRSAVDPPF
jgi:hypothetical protein